jgi:predicted permease
MPAFLHRLRARLRHRRFDADLAEELRQHEMMKRDELEAAGQTPDEARAGARRGMGNVTLMREDARGVWFAPWLESIVQDVRYAVRTLRRQPAHSVTAGLVLVLAIGVNVSLFGAFKALALDPWPVRDPASVVRVWARAADRPIGPSVDEYRFWREHARSFVGLVAHTPTGNGARLQAPGREEIYLQTVWVSGNFFSVLGAGMQIGSGFVDEDDLPGHRRAPLVISDTAWRTHFGADPSVVGRPVSVAGKPFTLVGVLEASFDGLGRQVDMWMPLSAMASVRSSQAIAWEPSRASAACCINVVGRVAGGVRHRQAAEELQVLHDRFSTATRRASGRVELYGTAPISGPGAGQYGLLGVFGTAVVLILILACANVGNLQLARGLARRRELATRMSIGASRARVVRQLLTEGLVLACTAGGVAVGVAAVLPQAVFRYMGEEIPPYIATRMLPDASLVLFALAVSVTACVAFALAPAIHATGAPIPMGSLDRGSTRPARFHLRSVLLAMQIAISAALLVGASLATRAVVHAMRIDPGFRVEGVDTIAVTFPAGTPMKARADLVLRVLDALEHGEGAPVAVADPGPIDDSPYIMHMASPHGGAREYERVLRRPASSRYFDVLGIPLVRGRMFGAGTPAEAVVNEAFARRYWPGEDPIGRPARDVDLKGEVRRTYTIVGVVRDTYLTGLETIDPVIFTPADYGAFLTRGGPASVERIRAAVLAAEPAAVVTVQPLTENLRAYLERSRTGAALAWAIGLLGLALAAVGVFGVFAYAVEERRREIGLRLALGAARPQIVGMLVSTSGRAMIAGLGGGLLLSLACGPLLRSYLYGLSPLDPLAYGLVMALLAGTAALATLVPARRACRVDPAVTLRED